MIQRILNIISSNSLLVVIYLINKGIDINYILNKLDINICFDLPRLLSYVIYIISFIFRIYINMENFKKQYRRIGCRQ